MHIVQKRAHNFMKSDPAIIAETLQLIFAGLDSEERKSPPQRKMGEILGISRSGVGQRIERLVRDGYLKSSGDGGYSITRKGFDFLYEPI